MEPTQRPDSPSGAIVLDSAAHQAVVRGRIIALKPTEFRVLQLLASEPGRTFSRDEILEGINDCNFAVGERSIDVHIVNLRRKLGPDRRLIKTDYGHGYRFIGST